MEHTQRLKGQGTGSLLQGGIIGTQCIGTLYVDTRHEGGGHPGGRGVTVLTPQVSTEHSSWLTKAGGCGTGRVILTK